jgi:receptor-type tyrosine-protein phosphatase gamma
VNAFTKKYDGEASEPVAQRTDISGPSAPIIVNLTCQSQDALNLRWKRPLTYYNTIDFYIISYRSVVAHEFTDIQINASASYLEATVSNFNYFGF